MGDLGGARVALLEARMSGELADLIRRFGGDPVCVPAVREATLDSGPEVDEFVDGLVAGRFPVVVFSTGVGVKALCDEAEKLRRLPELIGALKAAVVVCRGPKPTGALARYGVTPLLKAREPYTTKEILEAMSGLNLDGAGVALVHYGERNAALSDALEARGATLKELCLYEWRMPEDVAALRDMVNDIIERRFDVVAFTSQIQARHLFRVADEMKSAGELREALNGHTIVAAVGPTCAAALEKLGVPPRVVPEHPKMGAMVAALSEFVEQRRH